MMFGRFDNDDGKCMKENCKHLMQIPENVATYVILLRALLGEDEGLREPPHCRLLLL